MWTVLCLITIALVGASHQRVQMFSPAEDTAGIELGALSPTAYANYIDWWQTFMSQSGSIEEPAASEPPAAEPIDQSTCPKCTCGVLGKKNKIIGGNSTNVNQYPWMAMIMYKGWFFNEFYCGGSLINNKYVMTAAHCVHGLEAKNIGVRLLEHDLSTNIEAKHIDFKVSKVIIHKEYSTQSHNNDIALLRLDTKGVELGPNTGIYPVCLPAKGKSFAGYEGVITGWGATTYDGNLSQVLREVNVPIMSNEDCRKAEYYAKQITNNMICAGYPEGKKDSCQGDSGGPMHIKINSFFYIVGITSWGEGCGWANQPGVYTRVNRYLKWVADHTMDACSCSNAYAPPEDST